MVTDGVGEGGGGERVGQRDGLIKSESVESGGKGVCGNGIVGYDSGGEDVLTGRVSGAGIDGMGVNVAVATVIIEVVAGSGDAAGVGDGKDMLQAVDGEVSVRLTYADAPRLPLRVTSTNDDLATDFYHIVLGAMTPEDIGDDVSGISLSDGGAVDLYAGVVFLQATVGV
jgi:hypothetical protein